MSNPPGKVTYRVPTVDPRAAAAADRGRRPSTPNDGSEPDSNAPSPSGSSSRSRRKKSSSDVVVPLLVVCEPLFQQICLYNHAMQNGAVLSFAQVRREVEELFAQIRANAHSQGATAGLYDDRLEQSLLFFVDNFFADCGQTALASDWAQNRLAFSLNPPNYVGDEQFFTNLDKTLKEKTEGVKEKLAVYFTCIGLGMTGIYANQPPVLRRKQLEIGQRIRDLLESNAKRRICPDAYESINTDSLIEPPIKPPLLIAIALAGMMLVLLVVYFVAYKASTSKLTEHLDAIRKIASEQPAVVESPTKSSEKSSGK